MSCGDADTKQVLNNNGILGTDLMASLSQRYFIYNGKSSLNGIVFMILRYFSDNGIVMSCGDGSFGALGHGDWNSAARKLIVIFYWT